MPSLSIWADQFRKSGFSGSPIPKYLPANGLNKIFMRYVPTYYVAVNKLVIEQNRNNISKIDAEKFIPPGYGIHGAHELKTTREKKFCHDASIEIYEGYTVTFVALQLAYYFGFQTVLLVGVDHKYDFKGKPNEAHLMQEDDPNHFDSEYFKGQLWNNPDLVQSENSYRMAEVAYRAEGKQIINLTKDTELNVFQKDDISKW